MRGNNNHNMYKYVQPGSSPDLKLRDQAYFVKYELYGKTIQQFFGKTKLTVHFSFDVLNKCIKTYIKKKRTQAISLQYTTVSVCV